MARHRPGGWLAVVIALLIAAMATATALGADDTQTGVPQDNIVAPGLDVAFPDGTMRDEYPELFHFTLASRPGQTFVGYCIERVSPWTDDPVGVTTTTTIPTGGSVEAAIAWIIVNRSPAPPRRPRSSAR